MLRFFLFAFAVLFGASALASPELDARFALRSTFAVVLFPDTEALRAEEAEAEIAQKLRAHSRFDWNDEAFLRFKERLKDIPYAPLTTSYERWRPLLAESAQLGAQSVVLVDFRVVDGSAKLHFVMLSVPSLDVIQSVDVPVDERLRLASVRNAARLGLADIIRGVPFDASVVRREGYRVVLDRGLADIRQGMRVSVYTLEVGDGRIVFEETGVIQITRSEDNLAFGRILVERKPREVADGNKVRLFPSPPGLAAVQAGFPERGPAAVGETAAGNLTLESDLAFRKGSLGFVDVHLMGALLNWNRSAAGGEVRSDSAFYPGASVRGEVWLNRSFFADLGFLFGLSGISTPTANVSLNSQYFQVRAQAGYRLALLEGPGGPSVSLRLGYSRTQFSADDSTDPLAPTDVRYSGIVLGGGLNFPLTASFGLGLDLSGLFLPSLAEGALTSGASVEGINSWDFALRGFYNYSSVVNIEAKLLFQSHRASFAGTGTRPVSLSSMSQSARAFLLGVSYYF